MERLKLSRIVIVEGKYDKIRLEGLIEGTILTTDGFRIAEEDLRLRGPGDFFGQRQHGMPGFKIADLAQDIQLLREAQDAAGELLERDPQLASCPAAAERIEALFSKASDTLN